jgi:ABC-type Fe3+/spermidine/putrescine transport system ATPase subunit/ABC-type sulfate transport system permease component
VQARQLRSRARSPLPWLGGLLALYLLVPIVAFAVRLAGGAPASPGLGSALATSLFTATVSTAVITLLGTPLAYLLARRRGVMGRLLLALVALPLALPTLMSGILLLYVVGPFTLPGELFGGRLTDTPAGIILAQIFVAAPFLIIAARAAFAAVDPALEEVAATLGFGRVARFMRVAVPAALPGIAAGILLTWLRAFAEFGATVILAYHPFSLPVFTFVQFDETGLPGTMLPIAAALLAALVVLALAQLPIPRRRRGSIAAAPSVAVGVGGPPIPPALDFALSKRLGSFTLEIAHGSRSPRLALLGPSGAGKTLTLRLLAGLTDSEGGHVHVGSRALHGIPAERRQIAYVPQQPTLLPRRTVWQQATFGVGARPELAAWWLEQLGLQGLEDRYPEELSGGQQRRVALARALAVEPRVLLLDEPFTGLDAPIADRLRRELRRLQREAGLCTVIVTHDPEEAALLADEIIVLDHGRVLQAGARADVFRAPSSPEVAGLLGIANARRGVALPRATISSDGAEILTSASGLVEGSEVVWCVRPERISVDHAGNYEAVLLDDIDLGSTRELTVALAGRLELTVRTAATIELVVGERLRLDIPPQDVSVWPLSGPQGGGGDSSDSTFVHAG